MIDLALSFRSVIVLGLGATLTFDLWALFLKQVLGMTSANICLIGRWIRYMPEGIFRHSNIVSAPGKSAECPVGWIAHYMTGITFALAFIAIAGTDWLQHPTLIPAILFGVVTVAAPFCLMQPAFGLGLAASRTSNPARTRLRTLTNHTVFGLGLYFFGWLASWIL